MNGSISEQLSRWQPSNSVPTPDSPVSSEPEIAPISGNETMTDNDADAPFSFEHEGKQYTVSGRDYDATIETIEKLQERHNIEITAVFPEPALYLAFAECAAQTSPVSSDPAGLPNEEFWNNYLGVLRTIDSDAMSMAELVGATDIPETEDDGAQAQASAENAAADFIPARLVEVDDDTHSDLMEQLEATHAEMAAQRDSYMHNLVVQMVSQLSKLNVTHISDTSVLVAENAMLKSYLTGILEKIGVSVQVSVNAYDRSVSMRSRVLRFQKTAQPAMKDIKAGVVQALIDLDGLLSKGSVITNLQAELAESNRTRAATADALNDAQTKIIELNALLRDAKANAAIDMGGGVFVRIFVPFKTPTGAIQTRVFYLGATGQVPGKPIKVAQFKRVDSIAQAVSFEDGEAAKAAVARILKLAKNIDPKSGLKEKYLMGAVYFRQMEQHV